MDEHNVGGYNYLKKKIHFNPVDLLTKMVTHDKYQSYTKIMGLNKNKVINSEYLPMVGGGDC